MRRTSKQLGANLLLKHLQSNCDAVYTQCDVYDEGTTNVKQIQLIYFSCSWIKPCVIRKMLRKLHIIEYTDLRIIGVIES